MMLPGAPACRRCSAERRAGRTDRHPRGAAGGRKTEAPDHILTARRFTNALRMVLAPAADQCADPPHRDRGTRGRRRRPRRLRPDGARDAGADRPQADPPALFGGFRPRRRPGADVARLRAAAPSRLPDGHRAHAGREAGSAAAPLSNRTSCIRCPAPIYPVAAMAVLHGNLAPEGALIKQAAANQRAGRAPGRRSCSNLADLAARIDVPDLDVTADDILVMHNAGPEAPPACPRPATSRSPRSSCSQAPAPWSAPGRRSWTRRTAAARSLPRSRLPRLVPAGEIARAPSL